MKKEWYIYEMKEVLSPTGKPYVGSSSNFYIRAKRHKFDFKLEKRPELIPIDGPYYTRKEARKAEQPYRVANGWPNENEICRINSKKNVENKIGLFGMSEEDRFEIRSRGGKTSGNANVESGHLDRIRSKEASIIGGTIGGRKNVESGHLQFIASSGGIATCNIENSCPYCGRVIKGPSIGRHKQYCQQNPNK